ncbi:protein-tyrosine phosphatase-like protein [Mycena alexandri]|uniref:protein-tyrosine-phosphatase n=1 Tax=Mycena alexandri TaxID=1745969 RepID=A0AAD6TAY8_9AGAR|nr:protein-tyrosine phosphatase-like protein [Mycena alexandri]
MIRFDTLPPEVMQAMCTPMHQILPPTPLPPSAHASHPSSSSPYAPYATPSHSTQPPRMSGALYLGSLTASNDHPLLRSHGITHLVQALEASWAPPALASDGFSTFSVDIRDKESVDIGPHLERACVWIEGALRRGEGVLVHCQQGVSRSPSIIIAYLIRNHGMSYADALAFVKRKRACAKPNPGFARALVEWEHMWASRRGQGGRPGVGRRFTS